MQQDIELISESDEEEARSALLKRIKTSIQHRSFYHFTDKRNLGRICSEGGLYSTKRLALRGIKVPAPGGNEWSQDEDSFCGMDEYVHLSFTRGHPMAHLAKKAGRIEDLVWLRIKPEIIQVHGVLISMGVSNKKGNIPVSIADAMNELDLDSIYDRTDWCVDANKQRLHMADKCEVLIPTWIPLEYISNPHG
jgi:ssDNA thymidine ADP-ribosyltransferase, DarT